MDGANVLVTPDHIIYRASSLGGCTKMLAAVRQGYDSLPPPEAMQAVFDAGTEIERPVLERMVKMGWVFQESAAQKELVVGITTRIKVVGHCDEIGYWDDQLYVVEVKSQRQMQWDDFNQNGWDSGLFPKYSWQVSSYMIATGLPLILVRVNRDTWPELGSMAFHKVMEPPHSKREIGERIMYVESLAKGDLPVACDSPSYPCPVYYLHEDDRVRLDDGALEVLAREYKEIAAEEKVVAARKVEVRKRLRAGLLDDDKVTLGNGTRITFYTAKNPPKFDKEAAEKDGVDLSKYMKQGEVSERLRIDLPTETE